VDFRGTKYAKQIAAWLHNSGAGVCYRRQCECAESHNPNARILDGTGRVIERGSIVVRDGKIVAVSATAAAMVPAAQSMQAVRR
jgi:hypothetical protein